MFRYLGAFLCTLLPAFAQSQAWTDATNLNVPSTQGVTVTLADGRVLVAGGFRSTTSLTVNTSIYDPATARWNAGPQTVTSRADLAAVRLANGRVLLVGGFSVGQNNQLASAELFDGNGFSLTGSMQVARSDFPAVLLPGGKVLVSGGLTLAAGLPLVTDTAEVYDSATGTWSSAGRMNSVRRSHQATLLPDGRVLVSGGTARSGSGAPQITSEIFNPLDMSWTPVGSLNLARRSHTQTLLTNGRVLVAGGFGVDGSPVAHSELFNPASNTWATTGAMNSSRAFHSATLLSNGVVIAVGGFSAAGPTLSSTEYFAPGSGTWLAGPSLPFPRENHGAVRLAGGKILVAGGFGSGAVLATSALLGTVAPTAGQIVTVSAASYADISHVAPDSYAAAFGVNLSSVTELDSTLPLTLRGISARVRDTNGVDRLGRMYLISPNQINFIVPAQTALGLAQVTILRDGNAVATGSVVVLRVAPALFTSNATGQGLAAALALKYPANGAPSFHTIAASSIDLGGPNDQVFLSLFGTGLRAAALSGVRVSIGAVPAQVTFSGASPEFPGLDQVNALIPRALIGAGEVDVVLTVDGYPSNVARVNIR